MRAVHSPIVLALVFSYACSTSPPPLRGRDAGVDAMSPGAPPGLPGASAGIGFSVGPGGVVEAEAEAVYAHLGELRIVDVREREEIARSGMIAGAEHVPLAHLTEEALSWDRRAPVVIVCRSGRRSARAVHILERLGFDRAASMTGGLYAWSFARLPLVPTDLGPAPEQDAASARRVAGSSLIDVLSAAPIREVQAATLLLHGTEACVDGREDHSVLGTPGGDAGELLLALSTAEALTGHELSELEVVALLDAYAESFGRFYIHTDGHALERLRHALAADRRFSSESLTDIEAFVRRPSPALRRALLDHLVDPEHVGCGHLRLVLERPGDYGVRPALAKDLLRVVFRMLWAYPEQIDFVVLHGVHAEEAIVEVRVPGEVHAFSRIPALPPRIAGHSFFLHHPQAAEFLRAQHARFLYQELSILSRAEVSPDSFEAALSEGASRQLGLTLGQLAVGLPRLTLFFRDGRPEVSAVAPQVPAQPQHHH